MRKKARSGLFSSAIHFSMKNNNYTRFSIYSFLQMNCFNKNALYLSKNSTDYVASVNLINEKVSLSLKSLF